MFKKRFDRQDHSRIQFHCRSTQQGLQGKSQYQRVLLLIQERDQHRTKPVGIHTATSRPGSPGGNRHHAGIRDRIKSLLIQPRVQLGQYFNCS